MSKNNHKVRPVSSKQQFQDQIARKAERKLTARRDEDKGVIFWLGMFGLVGWSVTIPTVAGIALGLWVDATWPGRISWTLTLMFAGLVIGCFNAWYWVSGENKNE